HSPLACQASTLSRPLHTYQFFLAQSCRTLLCSTDRETDSPGRPSQRARIGNGDQELSRRHQRIAQAFRLDQKRGRNPRQRRTLLCADFWVRILGRLRKNKQVRTTAPAARVSVIVLF